MSPRFLDLRSVEVDQNCKFVVIFMELIGVQGL